MPPVRMRGDGRMAENPKQTLLRLLGYMKKYSATLVIVLAAIVMTSVAQTAAAAWEHWWTTIFCPWLPPAPRTLAPWRGI